MKIEVKGNYLVIERDISGVTKTFEYPQGRSFYFTRFGASAIEKIEIVNTINNGKTFVLISDINSGLILDENDNPYTLSTLLTMLQEFTGTFVGTNIKAIS
jgi:hypothetical protein